MQSVDFFRLSTRQNTMETSKTTSRNTVFVTVGTTRFDALIKKIDSQDFAVALLEKGYTSLIIQSGSTENYRIHNLVPPPATSGSFNKSSFTGASGGGGGEKKEQGEGDASLNIAWFDYAPSLASYLDTANLVISHAGAGSIFETLRRGLPLIAVPNSALMDNHQKELAEKLEEERYLASATPETLVEVVRGLDIAGLKQYVPGNGAEIVARVNTLCGFESGGVERSQSGEKKKS
jgi:beta-1,4-N-acetylglucosaminyltransferase